METAIKAINKWVFFGWNYSCVSYEWKGIYGENRREYVPRFLTEISWNCNFDHMLSKWHIATKDQDTDAYLVRFYAELGADNRRLLLEWVMKNYDDEQKIIGESESQESPEAQKIAEIREWAEDIPGWLSNREGYAKGYREGMIRAHKIVLSMITGEPLNE